MHEQGAGVVHACPGRDGDRKQGDREYPRHIAALGAKKSARLGGEHRQSGAHGQPVHSGPYFPPERMKMLLLSPELVTQSLTEKAVLLTLLKKRLKRRVFRSSAQDALNRPLSKKAFRTSCPACADLKRMLKEAELCRDFRCLVQPHSPALAHRF